MKKLALLLLLLGCVSLLVAPSFATTLNFDNIGPQGTLVGASYIGQPGGPNFTNDTTVLTCPYYNCSGYPYESPYSVAYSPTSGLIDVVWTTSTVSNISFYLDNPFYGASVTELSPNGSILYSAALPNTSYGQPGIVINLPGTGVGELQISGTPNYYVIDDLSYTAGGGNVPEPASLALFGSGIAAAAGMIRRKLTK